jgi:hypothetical protein
MNAIHYIGFDVHKKTISFCVKTAAGQIVEEGTLEAERTVLRRWAAARKRAWHGAMEATLFSAWIYDTLKPYAKQLSMGHPAKMKAITAGKNKSDRIDARMIADLLRCNLLPACYVLPPQLRDLRRLLRYRNLVVQQSVRMQNKVAGLLMESGTAFDKQRLHQKKYFADLMKSLQEVPESVKDLLRMSRGSMGDVSVHPEAARRKTAIGTCTGATRRTADEYPGGRPYHGSDLGAGNRRSASLLFHRRCRKLLRPYRSLSFFCRQTATWSDFQAAQCLAAAGVDRGRETGAALEPAIGGTARPRIAARSSQSRDLASGAKACGLPAGCGQEWSTLSGTHATSARKRQGKKEDSEKEQEGSRFGASRLKRTTSPAYALTVRFVKTEHVSASFLRHADLSPDGHSVWRNTKGNLASQIPQRTHRWDESDRVFLAGCSPAEPASASSIHSAYQNFYVRSVSDPSAGPCVVGDCVREFWFPIHLPSVSRPAGLLSLNLRGPRLLDVVPANGCLATLPLRWSC